MVASDHTGRAECPWCQAPIVPAGTRLQACAQCGKRVEVVSDVVGQAGPHRHMTVAEALPAPLPPPGGRLREEQDGLGADLVTVAPPLGRAEAAGRAGGILFFGGVFLVWITAWILGKLGPAGELWPLLAVLGAIGAAGGAAAVAYRRMLRAERVRIDDDSLMWFTREGRLLRVPLDEIQSVSAHEAPVIVAARGRPALVIGEKLSGADARWLGARIDRACRVHRLRGRELQARLPPGRT